MTTRVRDVQLGGSLRTDVAADGQLTAASLLRHDAHYTLGATEFVLSDGSRPTISASSFFPRIVMADGVDTTVVSKGFGLDGPNWWELGRVDVGLEYVNDHVNATGNARVRYRLMAVNNGLQTLSQAVAVADSTFNVGMPASGGGITIVQLAASPFDLPDEGVFGTLFCVVISRLGSDTVNDTFGGPFALHTTYGVLNPLPAVI